MEFAGINYWGVIAAAVAGYAFGAAYYMALSGPWVAATGKSEAEIKARARAPVMFAVAFAANLVMAYVLAGALGHLGEVTMVNGIVSAAIIWAGFVATTMIVNYGYQGARKTLTLIDGAHWLGVVLIQGLVIGAIGV